MVNKKLLLLVIASMLATFTLSAQRLFRSEIAPYSLRADALAGKHSTQSLRLDFSPQLVGEVDGQTLYSYSFSYPVQWSDGRKVLHLESIPSALLLRVNGVEVGALEDTYTPTDIDITRYLSQSDNVVELLDLQLSSPLEQGLSPIAREPFVGSYISHQSALNIEDFTLSLQHDHDRGCAYLTLEVVVRNLHSTAREIEVGFDIYDPKGRLLEYDFAKSTLEGGGCDTLSFSRPVWGTGDFKWGIENVATTRKGVGALSSPLYSVMLFTRIGSVPREYIPLKVGYTDFKVEGGRLTSFGKPLNLISREVSAAADRALTEKLFSQLKVEGVNMLIVEYAQPEYFYQVADAMGMLVVDRVSISAPAQSDNRAVGGTSSNDPTLVEEYLSRGKGAYYRSRNHTSVVAYTMGSDSGNGYNMYRLYELLRQAEPSRPIVYQGAKGEWNSDAPITMND